MPNLAVDVQVYVKSENDISALDRVCVISVVWTNSCVYLRIILPFYASAVSNT